MEKIIYKLIEEFTKGVDSYTHNGSTWLIFTETKQWVIELTKDKTLWYNYTFFRGMFSIASMDVVENDHYITQWVEDNIINKVEHTSQSLPRQCSSVDDIIENGVRHTEIGWHQCNNIDDAIEKGVKVIKGTQLKTDWSVEDTIKNGVRVISPMTQYDDWQVEEIIENGINKTKHCLQHVSEIENVIDNGVKETHSVSKNLFWEIGNTLQNGVKETHRYRFDREGEIENTLENGVKETELKTGPRNLEQFGQGYSLWKAETIINEGIKEIKGDSSQNPMGKVSEAIKNGIKEIRPVGCPDPKTGIHHFRIQAQVDDVVDNGVIETKTMDEWVNSPRIVGEVIDNGILETIREGVKDTKPIGKEAVNYPTGVIGYIINNGVKESGEIS